MRALRCLLWRPAGRASALSAPSFPPDGVRYTHDGHRTTDARPPRGDADDAVSWLDAFVDRAVGEGRQTPEAAAYFRAMLQDEPGLVDCAREAQRLTGGQDPTSFTPYQQGLFADRLGHFTSGLASRKLMAVQQEEQQGKNFTKDGTPTGEEYWYEAGTTLASPGVPGYVKDEIFSDMQRARRADSPAFEVPAEARKLAEDDEGFGASLRRQRQVLFSGADFTSTEK